MEAIFFNFENTNYKGMVAVSNKYSDHITNLLNSYYSEETSVTPCAKSVHGMAISNYIELFTSYSEVNLNERLAIWEVDNDGISSGRQPEICNL